MMHNLAPPPIPNLLIDQKKISQLKSNDEDALRINLLSDFLFFAQFFFKVKSGKDFIISKCKANTPHAVIFAREFTDVFLLRTNRLAINCPPGWHKSEFLKMFIMWATAHYPDCNHLYISYGKDLAASHTQDIRDTMLKPIYSALFNVKISKDSSAKDFFMTTAGGQIAAFGSSGAITGRSAGLPGQERYSGANILDDLHKPDEAHSDNIREGVIKNYHETIDRRRRGINVPTIAIGQRLHEQDFFAHAYEGPQKWKKVILTSVDAAGNNRYPEIITDEELKILKETQPYVYASQCMQNPIPAGGALFKKDYFALQNKDPHLLATLISVDSSETTKSWNDKTVFSFWGLHKMVVAGVTLDNTYGLYWLDCIETQVEPADLEDAFMSFWVECMRHTVQPSYVVIEEKSTGVSLISVLEKNNFKGIIKVKPNASSGSKSQRYIDIQQYLAAQRVSLPANGRHTQMCIDHMIKITANETHRWDDIADTCQMAVKAALMDKIIVHKADSMDYDTIARGMMGHQNKIDSLKRKSYGSFRSI